MTDKHTTTVVQSRPPCDICGEPAQYDAKTKHGPWGWLCQADFDKLGVGLGLGLGQKLIVTDEGAIA